MDDHEKIKSRSKRPDLPTEYHEIQCPVCGYYCLGNGGHGCIDKPGFVDIATHHGASIDEAVEMCSALDAGNRVSADD